MANTPDRKVKIKHRAMQDRYTRNKIKSLQNAKKKTLEALYDEGRLPKVLFNRIGL
jgi:hypothetical protein